MSPTPSPLPGFTTLNDGVWHYKPAASNSNELMGLVVLCTWMGAALRHVAKYTSQYQQSLPHAQILVIQSDLPDVFWRTDAYQEKRMAPARDVICAVADANSAQAPSESNILLHVFSNGGCQSACQLASQLRARPGKRVSLRAIIFDSCPGKASFGAAISALSALLPKNGIRRLWGLFLTYLGFSTVWIFQAVFRRELMVDKVRRLLNTSTLFDTAVPRTYIFSKADQMIDWHDVTAHASEAQAKGYRIREELFGASSHVAHAMLDRERYWKIVRSAHEYRVS